MLTTFIAAGIVDVALRRRVVDTGNTRSRVSAYNYISARLVEDCCDNDLHTMAIRGRSTLKLDQHFDVARHWEALGGDALLALAFKLCR